MIRTSAVYWIIGIAVLTGCGKKTTTTGPEGETVTVEQKGDQAKVTLQDDRGKQTTVLTGDNVKLPPKFSEDIPVYENAKPVTVVNAKEETQVIFKVKGSLASIAKFYDKQLSEKGWSIEGSFAAPTGTVMNAKKGSRRLVLMINSEKDECTISVSVAEQK